MHQLGEPNRTGQPHIAQIGAVRRRSADRIKRRAANEQVEICTLRPERVIARCADRGASLPPAVLADHHARVEVVVEARAGAHAALRRLDRDPVAVGNSARLRRHGMQFDFRMRSTPAQRWQGAVLGLAEKRRLRAGQDQRETRRQIGPRHRADLRLLEIG